MFAEFFCANSFAGMHQKDDRKQLVLFDVETDRGMVIPDRFIQNRSSSAIAETSSFA
ncbi:hypothetical protein QUB05_03120 [Microcoleus sp. F10-C6]|uniref:hypothetical protein n=1 Tax=unclassified Microcoleus TaxID=2642155 RepID=UPI002FCECF6F